MSSEFKTNYFIVNDDGETIAMFRREVDRNIALRALTDAYPDYSFEPYDEPDYDEAVYD